MGLRGRHKPQKALSRAEQRVRGMTTEDLLSWTEAALYGVGRQVHSWRSKRDEVTLLEEASEAAEVLQVVVVELQRRATAGLL